MVLCPLYIVVITLVYRNSQTPSPMTTATLSQNDQKRELLFIWRNYSYPRKILFFLTHPICALRISALDSADRKAWKLLKSSCPQHLRKSQPLAKSYS